MTVIGSDEVFTPDDELHSALLTFTSCVGNAVEGICSYSLTIGETYVPFLPSPDDTCLEDEEACSQLWVRVTNVQPEANQSWAGDCAVVLNIGLEVGVLRCVEVPEDGEAPDADEVLVAALQAMTDMRAIFCAAMGCDEAFSSIESGAWSPNGPNGGQVGGVWTFTAQL